MHICQTIGYSGVCDNGGEESSGGSAPQRPAGCPRSKEEAGGLMCLSKMPHSALNLIAMVLCLGLAGCGGGGGDPFEQTGSSPFGENFVEALVQRYSEDHQAGASDAHDVSSGSKQAALYLDFSSGINNAFLAPGIQPLMSSCFNTVLADQFEVFKLGGQRVERMSVDNNTQLGERVANPKEYRDIYAPLQQAVTMIAEGGSDALLITDFEEWQNKQEIVSTAYLKLPFVKWLRAGNSITFFVADFNEAGAAKHLYFTVFTKGEIKPESLVSRLQSRLSGLPRIDLGYRKPQIRTEYSDRLLGGIFRDVNGASETARNVLDLKTKYFNGVGDGLALEIYPIGVDWATLDEVRSTYAASGDFNDLFRGLFIDLTGGDSFEQGGVELEAYSVGPDFESFARAREASKRKPKLNKGPNGETKMSDSEADPVALACYGQDGTMLSECAYKPVPATRIDEVFALNSDLFANTRKENPASTEIGVGFHAKYSAKNYMDPDGLVRIDLYLSPARVKATNPKFDLLKWNNAKGIPNVALLESVTAALSEPDMLPGRYLFYTYYFKPLVM